MGLNDNAAYAIYGAYTALVYMTPFFGGMLADRLLGRRRAVVFGGLLMAAGHMLMMVEETTPFFVALALLIAGNGFFKPNISTIVGELYPKVSKKKDAGFTLFYMGINLGALLRQNLPNPISGTGRHLEQPHELPLNILHIARSLADLAGDAEVGVPHLAEALALRGELEPGGAE